MTFRNALISVSNKTNLSSFVSNLIFPYNPRVCSLFNIYSTGGTYNYLKHEIPNTSCIKDVESLTKFPEILNGRVKTLHPNILGGILCDKDNDSHNDDIKKHNIQKIDLIVANLYPFQNTISGNKTYSDIIENIDIGGATMIRAAAKNYKDTCILIDPSQYDEYIKRFRKNEITLDYKRKLAATAFSHIADYDNNISEFFNPGQKHYIFNKKYELKYGINPTNTKSSVCSDNNAELPFKILNGHPGYINFLDAIGSWRLVNELTMALGTPACASFKHTIPAGVAIKTDTDTDMCDVYIRTRNIDPLSSFGDFIAIKGNVDLNCAKYISNVVSDGIVAESYDNAALECLSNKKNGKFVILQGQPIDFFNDSYEIKSMHGTTLIQKTEKGIFNDEKLNDIVTYKRDTNDQNRKDMIIASIAIKYAQSNSVAFAYNGQLIGLGAGQQNRLDCIRLAGNKALLWWLRNNKATNEYFDNSINNKEIFGQTRISLFYDFLNNHINSDFKRNIQKSMNNVVMSSDGFIPFSDNIQEANKYGVSHIVNPGGSIRDKGVIMECDKNGIVMFNTNQRLFFH